MHVLEYLHRNVKTVAMPTAMVVGALLCRPVTALEGWTHQMITPSLIFLMLFVTFCRVKPRQMKPSMLHLWLLLFQVVVSVAVYFLLLLVWNLCPEDFREIELPEFCGARLELSALFQIEGQPFGGCLHQVRGGQIGQLHFRVPLSYLRHSPLQPLNVFVPIQHAESFLPDGGAENMDNLLPVGILERFAIHHQGSDASLSLHPDHSRLTVPRDVVELVGREVVDIYGSRKKHPACLS